MNDDEKLMWMFEEVHGKITGSCYTEINYNDDQEPIGVSVMKDGNLCWSRTKSDLVFEFLTRHL
jgi:hypothetical protein